MMRVGGTDGDNVLWDLPGAAAAGGVEERGDHAGKYRVNLTTVEALCEFVNASDLRLVFALNGGFGEISTRVFEGRVTMDWYAPEELESSEDTRVWVVFQSEEGGTAVWSEEWTVDAGSE